ncbi:tetratricopeptide repeat protein [Streptomyces sp. NPDC001178]
MAHWERAPWLVGIARAEGGPPIGGGVLVTDRHVVTCAHVAAPHGAHPEPPPGPVFVSFQWAGTHDPVPAVVVADGWHPQDTKERRGDLAVLELQGPAPESAGPARLVSTRGGTFGHRFYVYGYPEGHKEGGVPADGVVRGPAGHEWIELESGSTLGHRLAPGFSGSPVWDLPLGGVIGVVAMRDKPVAGQDPGTAYAIPVETIAGYWPPLRQLIHDPVTEQQRARIDSLLARPLDSAGELPRIRDIPIYDIGVTQSKDLGDRPDPPYVPRLKEDRELDEALHSQPFVLLSGDSKAGKSRTLIERLREALHPDTRLIVPGPVPSAPGELAALPLPTGGDRAVLWLDDIDEYLRPGGVDVRVLEAYAAMEPPVTVVATITSEWLSRLKAPQGEVNRTARQVLNRVTPIVLPRLLREEDLPEARRLYPQEDFTDRGIGELMVAAPLVEARFNGGRDTCPEGWAVVRAAADWHRMGCETPLTGDALAQLFARYLAAGPSNRAMTEAALGTGIAWATEPVAGSIALLRESRDADAGPSPSGAGAEDGDDRRYEAFAYLPGYLDGRDDPETSPVPRFAWEWAVRAVPPDHLLGVAFAAFTRKEQDVAVGALERAHTDATNRGVRAWAALMLGEMAMYLKDMARAKVLLEEAAGSGSSDVLPLAQVDLAAVLQVTGDMAGARRQLEAAIASGDPQAAPLARASLGGVLLSQGETERARELLESALGSGDSQVVPIAQSGFAGLIVQRGEMSGAGARAKRAPSAALPSGAQSRLVGTEPLSLPRAVRQSAIASAVPLAQVNLSAALLDEGELDRADELLAAALSSGNPLVVPLAQANLGALCIQRGELDRARDLLDAAAASEHLFASEHAQVTLAWLYCLEERLDEADAVLERAVHFTNPEHVLRAQGLLAAVQAARGDFEAAAERLQRVVDSGHPGWAAVARSDQAMYWAQAGYDDRALAALTEVAESGHPDQAPRAADLLGDVKAALEDWPGAEAAYRAAIASGHRVWAPMARLDLALLFIRLGDERGPDLLTEIIDSDEPDLAPRAADLLGDTLAARGDWAGAEAAYQRAMDFGHQHWSAVARIDLALMLAEREDGTRRAEALFTAEARSGSALAEIAEAFLGILLVQEQRTEEGRPILARIAESDSEEARDLAGVQLAKLAAQEGRPEEAAERFEALLASDSRIATSLTPLALAHLGAIKLQQGDVEAALDLLDEATASGQTDATAVALLGRGEYLVEVGDMAAAQPYLRAALDLDEPDVTPRALAHLGWTQLAENDLEEARETLTRALATDTPSIEPLTRRLLGSALARLGRRTEARETLLPLARSDDPEHRPQALVILGRLAMLDGYTAEGQHWLREAVASDDPDARTLALTALGDAPVASRPALVPAGSDTRPREITTTPGRSDAPAADVRPSSAPEEPARPAPSSDGPPSVGLPPGLFLLLGRIAEGEGLPDEARYWLEKALAAGLTPDAARPLLTALPADDTTV